MFDSFPEEGRRPQQSSEQSERAGGLRYDPTMPSLLRTANGNECPGREPYSWVRGVLPPRLNDLERYLVAPESGSLSLPGTIPLVRDGVKPTLDRRAEYGISLCFSNETRCSHVLVMGVTGAGKNVHVLDPLRASAIADQTQTVISFTLKSSDTGPITELAAQSGRKVIRVNLSDPGRSVSWNPLATMDADRARAMIRRFCDATRNLNSHETEFWHQQVRLACEVLWEAGVRSFPEMAAFYAQPLSEVVQQLERHEQSGGSRIREFLKSQCANSQTSLAHLQGAFESMMSKAARQLLKRDELELQTLFQKPVILQVEVNEARLESDGALNRMLAGCIVDALVEQAECVGNRQQIPATIFIDDLPSVGRVLSPQRLLTMRSRGIGVVAGVQSIESIRLAYPGEAGVILEGFASRIVLPGCGQSDAKYFSDAAGEVLVKLQDGASGNSTFMEQPLLTAAAIRSPLYRHPLLGRPATLLLGDCVFQAYLQRSYELPQIAAALRQAQREEQSRANSQQPSESEEERSGASSPAKRFQNEFTFPEPPEQLTDTTGWTRADLNQYLISVRQRLGWKAANEEERRWWREWVRLHRKEDLRLVRLMDELVHRGVTISRFHQVCRDFEGYQLRTILAWLDFCLLSEQDLKEECSE